jgi:hypothetical protein
MLRSLMLTVLAAVLMEPASASSFEGQIEEIIFGKNTLQAGGTRVSIRLGSRTSPCASPIWFAYEYSDTSGGPAKAWTATAIAARLAGQRVKVEGTGACDQHNIEVVNAIFPL